MGTNHYLAARHLHEHFDDGGDPGLHIGKSSAGWTYSWRAHPELGINTRDDWERLFVNCGDAIIVNEYGDMLTFREFKELAFIEHRDPDRVMRRERSPKPSWAIGDWDSYDDHGEHFTAREFC